MPVGVIVNCTCVLVGGLFGALLKNLLPAELKDKLTLLFGLSAMGIGIVSLLDVNNLTVVVLSILCGLMIGHYLRLEARVMWFFTKLVDKMHIGTAGIDRNFFATAVALFCCSGFGWYATLIEGISGNPAILLGKSVLDFFTAAVFASSLGLALCSIPIPQLVVLLGVFFAGKLLSPYLAPTMFADLSACGGILTLATGLCVAKIKDFPLINMMPALLLVMPLSAFLTVLLG